MTRFGAALALVCAAWPAAIADAPARSAPAAGPLALVRGPDRETVLVRLEPRTLRPAGTRVRLDRHTGAWRFSPDGAMLVLRQTSKRTLGSPASLRFVDVRRMRAVGDVTKRTSRSLIAAGRSSSSTSGAAASCAATAPGSGRTS